MKDANERMSDEALELVARRFAVLSEPMRLRLLQSLIDGEKNVNALVAESGGTQANVSRHLQTLAREGLLSRRREGLQVFYSVADESVFNMCCAVCGGIRESLKKDSKALG
ncbi:MAG: winged helix-turn-helix transcriptional regulator [Opitutales bacterium]|nr:winged helix-turn-helix transcriptional regulator [Opitutales bacterium]